MPPPGVNASEMMAQMLVGQESCQVSNGKHVDGRRARYEQHASRSDDGGWTCRVVVEVFIPTWSRSRRCTSGGWGEGLGPNGGIVGHSARPFQTRLPFGCTNQAQLAHQVSLSDMFDGDAITCLALVLLCNMSESQRDYENSTRISGDTRVRFITIYF